MRAVGYEELTAWAEQDIRFSTETYSQSHLRKGIVYGARPMPSATSDQLPATSSQPSPGRNEQPDANCVETDLIHGETSWNTDNLAAQA